MNKKYRSWSTNEILRLSQFDPCLSLFLDFIFVFWLRLLVFQLVMILIASFVWRMVLLAVFIAPIRFLVVKWREDGSRDDWNPLIFVAISFVDFLFVADSVLTRVSKCKTNFFVLFLVLATTVRNSSTIFGHFILFLGHNDRGCEVGVRPLSLLLQLEAESFWRKWILLL